MLFGKHLSGTFLKFILTTVTVTGIAFAQNSSNSHGGSKSDIKNIIVIVSDGCGLSLQTLSRWYKGDDLQVDQMTAGSVKTWAANSVITGSAAAASAFATGFKVDEPHISVGPAPEKKLSSYQWPLPSEYLSYRPLATVLEGAKLQGKSTGLIATQTISAATPAAQAAHVHSRSDETQIIEQQVYQNIDVVFGGGKNNLTTSRRDGENLVDTLKKHGYQWVETRDQMLGITTGKVWGLFAPKTMQAEIDRIEMAPTEPRFPEMVQKAIDILSQNNKGFFLFAEASQTDNGNHWNDPIWSIGDFLAFDEAVRIAVEFAKADGHTAVLAFPDHNCGGLSIGSAADDKRRGNDEATVEHLLNPLKNMHLTATAIQNKIGSGNLKNPVIIRDTVSKWWNIDLTDQEMSDILNGSGTFYIDLPSVVCKSRTAIGWTTNGHDGTDVPIWTYNCDFSKTINNTDIASRMFNLFDIDSKRLNDYLFVNVDDVFPNSWTLDKSNAANPVLVITRNEVSFRLPVSKDELHYAIPDSNGGSPIPIQYDLSGVVVYAPITNRVYIPQDAVDEIQKVCDKLH
jgi:alkaline phosphatase